MMVIDLFLLKASYWSTSVPHTKKHSCYLCIVAHAMMFSLISNLSQQGWRVGVLCLVWKVNCACDLTFQPDYQFWFPVWIPVMQGTGGLSSADRTWIRSCNRDFNLTVYPSPYMRKGLVPFLWNSSTQLHKCNQGFPP